MYWVNSGPWTANTECKLHRGWLLVQHHGQWIQCEHCMFSTMDSECRAKLCIARVPTLHWGRFRTMDSVWASTLSFQNALLLYCSNADWSEMQWVVTLHCNIENMVQLHFNWEKLRDTVWPKTSAISILYCCIRPIPLIYSESHMNKTIH